MTMFELILIANIVVLVMRSRNDRERIGVLEARAARAEQRVDRLAARLATRARVERVETVT